MRYLRSFAALSAASTCALAHKSVAIHQHASHAADRHGLSDWTNYFLPPLANKCVYYVNLQRFDITSRDECANACLNYAGADGPCISFNSCGGDTVCGIQGYNKNWTILDDQLGCVAYQRIMPRNDTLVTPAIARKAVIPATAVQLAGAGLLGQAFATNIQYLSSPRNLDDLLYPYRLRFNASYDGPGRIWGWDDFVPGSVASGWMQGAGGALKWQEVPALRQALDTLVAGIAAAAQPNGFAVGYAEEDTNSDFNGDNQNPSYVQSWFLHGLLEADAAGNPQALAIARAHSDWWNNCTYLPELYPQDSGPDHWGPAPNGYNPSAGTMSSAPFAHGHMLYWMNQAGIGHSRMAVSERGTQADVDFLANLFTEDWWLAQLAARVPQAIYARQWYPDNYEVCTLETYADMYQLTGQQKYLDGVLGGWALFRDPTSGWMFPGGSFALNENYVYPPGSYPLEYTNGDGWGVHTRPTGEMCPSAFWIKLNQRLHSWLDPDNETFSWEIERSLYNIALPAQGANGTGVRYFAVMHKSKASPQFDGTCCEAQNTRIFGSVPEYVFSTMPGGAGVRLNLWEAGSITTPTAAGGGAVTVSVATAWPYDTGATVSVSTNVSLAAGSFDLALRMPAWLAGPIAPTVNGQPYTGGPGVPGTYLHLAGLSYPSTVTSVVSLSLPMAWNVHPYNGSTQIAGYTGRRFAYTLGPFLMAVQGPWDDTTDCIILGGGLDPMQPASWLTPVPLSAAPAGGWYPPLPPGATQSLRYTINGLPGYSMQPYFAVPETELFTTYPIVA